MSEEDREKIICNCLSITQGEIEDVIKSGLTTFEEVQNETGCGTCCGMCVDDVQEIIDKMTSK